MARFEEVQRKLAKRLRLLRAEKGFRQADLDETEHAVSLTFIQAIERGTANPSLLTLHRISRRLGIRLKDLVDFD